MLFKLVLEGGVGRGMSGAFYIMTGHSLICMCIAVYAYGYKITSPWPSVASCPWVNRQVAPPLACD